MNPQVEVKKKVKIEVYAITINLKRVELMVVISIKSRILNLKPLTLIFTIKLHWESQGVNIAATLSPFETLRCIE